MTTRRWPRIEIELDVHVRFESASDVLDARTLNVSREGVFIAMDEPAALGTRVRLTVDVVDSGERLTAEGLVIRRQPDPDEPATANATRGIAVFLTLTDARWPKWCDELFAKRGAAPKP